jgi:hypothetical protein
LPPQQSALDAHPEPAVTHCAYVQRGTPTLSCWHVSRFWPSQTPLQQSHDELHDMLASLQTSPLGLHPCGFSQMPTPPSVAVHVTGPLVGWLGIVADPQQSESLRQTSPTGWQPLAGWQTSTPVGPHGAHDRLQHAPPQTGMPPSTYVVPPSGAEPPQSMPSTSPQFAPPPLVEPEQVPATCPDAVLQMPVQQSELCVQISPAWPQKDEG